MTIIRQEEGEEKRGEGKKKKKEEGEGEEGGVGASLLGVSKNHLAPASLRKSLPAVLCLGVGNQYAETLQLDETKETFSEYYSLFSRCLAPHLFQSYIFAKFCRA